MRFDRSHCICAIRAAGLLMITMGVGVGAVCVSPPGKPVPSTLRSDNYNTCVLQTFWTVEDPLGGATVACVGVGTDRPGLAVSIPAGAPRELTPDSNGTSRVTQQSANSDLDVRLRVAPQVTAATQSAGLIVEGEDGRVLTFSIGSDGGSLALAAQTLESGTLAARGSTSLANPEDIWLSLRRSGNEWLLAYSPDGQQFTDLVGFAWDVVVTRVGVFAASGPAGSISAFAPLFSAFEVSGDPLPGGGPTGSGATLATSVVGEGSVQVTPNQPAYYCGETLTLTATPAEGWRLLSWSGDLSGSELTKTLDMPVSRTVSAVFVPRTYPVITNIEVMPNPTGALVTWLTDVPASSAVRYGTTPNYEAGASGDSALAMEHSVRLTGLTTGQLYHLQIVSVDAETDEVRSGDMTFTPGDMSGIESDDFNNCILEPFWTVTDPTGDATVTITGVGTADALLQIALPAGVSHDFAGTADNTVRVLRPAGNVDFEVQTKLQSQLVASGQYHGLRVQGDLEASLLFFAGLEGTAVSLRSFTYAGSAPMERASQPITDTSPLWLSIRRTGSNWTLRYSIDGQTWTEHGSFTWQTSVTHVGLFAANSGGAAAPAFTAKFDYFANAFAPLLSEDVIPRTEGGTLTRQVNGSGEIVAAPERSFYYCGEPVQLTAVPTVGWLFTGWSGDLSGTDPEGTLSMNQPRSVAATFEPDLRPLLLADITLSPTTTGATVSWNTNKLATAQVLYGRTSSHELGSPQDSQYALAHSIVLTGLSPTSVYHYSVRSVDGLGNVQTTPNAVFYTPGTGAIVSDDFNVFNLNPAVWTAYDPLGDSTFAITGTNTGNAQLLISVPAGRAHDISSAGGVTAPHLTQTVSDTDFTLIVKFDSDFTQSHQGQGVLVTQDAGKFIRSDFHGEAGTAALFVSTIEGGGSTVIRNAPISVGAPYYQRITRTGSAWTVEYSKDGASWLPGASFTFTINVSAVGVWAANTGSSPPAFTAAVDYFFNAAAPIAPEDGTAAVDGIPPNLISPRAQANRTAVNVSWGADKPVTTRVDYGLSTSYELGSVNGNGLLARDSVTFESLNERTTYHFRIVATDTAGNSSQSPDLVATTTSVGGPTVDVWYGAVQEFGRIGAPTPFINVLGNVSDPNGVSSISYALNGGSAQPLSQGPNSSRLASPGDFNVDVPFASLLPGLNALQITAVNGLGQSSIADVQVINSAGARWPLPYSINWSAVTNINDVAQVIDGEWQIDGGTVRPTVLAYDRLIGIGDVTWTDYEVLVPITPYGIDPAGYASPSNGPGIGVLLRWPGHSFDGRQPWEGVYPLGGLGMYRWTTGGNEWQMFGNNGVLLQTVSEPLTFGVTLMYRMRVQTDPNTGAAIYRLRVWPAGAPEPGTWKVSGTQFGDPGQGCLLLLAHHVDATFGPVSITPGPFPD